MNKQLEQLKDFHRAFDTVDPEFIKARDLDLAKLRAKLIEEESKEVLDELLNETDFNVYALAKELADLLYVTYGTINAYGLTSVMEDVFDEVHRSNMSKLGKNGKPIYRADGKVLKGENYSPADIEGVIEDAIRKM